MVDQKFSEKVAEEDIKAEVEKTSMRLFFSGVVLFMVLVGFCIRTCANSPAEPNYSVECTKAGGQWIPEDFKVINGYSNKINAYCSLKNKESIK